MKIAFIVDRFPIISETFILNQITGLISLGHKVEVFAESKFVNSKIHSDILKYDILKKTHYPNDIMPAHKIKRFLKALALTIKNPIAALKSINFFRYGKNALNLRYLFYVTYFLNNNFDLIHCHFGPVGNNYLFLKDILNQKYIVTFHGYDVTSYIKRESKVVYSRLFKQGNLFTYNSEATKKKLLEIDCPSQLLVKLPMGTKLSKFTFEIRKMGWDEKIKILSVGRLVEMKGREYAIKAVARIIKRFPNVLYKIAGDGPQREKLYKLIKGLKVENSIHLLGWVDSDELEHLYKTSHIFLHPSVTSSNGNMEGQGVVLIEAQACGLPVIATNHNAFPESIVNGKSGLLVKEKDINDLDKKLSYLIENHEIWPKMGRAGRKFVEKNFDIDKLNKKLVQIYQTVINNGKK